MESSENVNAYFSPLGRMRMLGGTPALDFANTLHWRDGALADFTPSYSEFVAWCVPAQLLSPAEAKRHLKTAKHRPAETLERMEEILHLRDALKKWLTASAFNLNNSPKAATAALRALRRIFGGVAGNARLQDVISPEVGSQVLDLPLLRCTAAILLLTLFPPPGDIRRCEADHCGGFFLNQSRSKPRRWCSMDGCGNRAKAARFRKAHQTRD